MMFKTRTPPLQITPSPMSPSPCNLLPSISKLTRILPRARPRRRAPPLTPPLPHLRQRNNQLLNLRNPLTLQQLDRTRPHPRIALKAPFQKVNPLLAQLLPAGQLRRIALRNVVHDGPLVVEGRPGPAASAHFEDDAAERPDVDGTQAAFVAAFDDFGGHVHGGAGHGFLLGGDFGAGAGAGDGGGVWLEGFVLAGDYFGGAEVDVFDYAVVVEEDVCGGG